MAETRKLDQLYNHTPADGTVASPDNSAMLNNAQSKWIGPAKSLRVAPGDTVSLEVYAQFASYSGDGSKVLSNTLLGAIAGAFTPLNASAEVTQQILNQFTLAGAGSLSPAANTDAPAAYLNYLLFDNNFELAQSGFAKISTSAEGAFELLALNNIAITEAGYLYIYVSNEDASNVNVYFDDLKVTHEKSRIVQMEDYYPFGLTFNSYQRPNITEQNYQYNGKELQDELDVNWLDYGARMYMADIGRWGVVDPMAEGTYGLTPYHYVYDNPTAYIDPDGMWGDYYTKDGKYLGNDGVDDNKVYTASGTTVTKTKDENGAETETTTFNNAEEIGKVTDFVDMGSATISSETTKKNLVGLSIYLRNNVEGQENAKVLVTGGNRSSARNAQVGGATGSEHLTGSAADIAVSGMSLENLAVHTANSGLFTSVIFYPTMGDTKGFGAHLADVSPSNVPFSSEIAGAPQTTQLQTTQNVQQLRPHVHVGTRNRQSMYRGRYIGFNPNVGKNGKNLYSTWKSNTQIR